MIKLVSVSHQDWKCSRKLGCSHMKAIRQANRLSTTVGVHFNAYACEYCGKWHVGRDRSGQNVQIVRVSA